jgi:hypothetical protein
MSYYYKRHWDETTGDALTDSWGTSTFYFETDRDFNVTRQIQIFELGQVLKYSDDYSADKFGALSDQPLDSDEFSEFAIDKTDFEQIWNSSKKYTVTEEIQISTFTTDGLLPACLLLAYLGAAGKVLKFDRRLQARQRCSHFV